MRGAGAPAVPAAGNLRTAAALVAAAVTIAATPAPSPADEAAASAAVIARKAPEPAGVGPLEALEFERASDPGYTLIRGPDARRQLVVTGRHAGGRLLDWTRSVAYEASPPGVVAVEAGGLTTPLAGGKATVVARAPGGESCEITLAVEGFDDPPPVSFPNQIVPIFTKHACNSGGCHGKSAGQNGFKLSLLGFHPEDDHEYLVKEARGRRIFAAAPERSLILQKATNAVPHGGGLRFEPGSPEERLLARWMLQGMPYGRPEDPRVVRLEIVPETRAMERGAAQQIAVFAHYSDGFVEDATRMAQYESNDREMAEAGPAGLVKTLDLAGEAAVMVRYQGQVGVFRASVPLGVEVQELPPRRNFIDDIVFSKLVRLGIPPSPPCDDATFIRRATLDIAGRLPTAAEMARFLADQDPARRDQLIDRLLAGTDHAEFFANKWSALLRNRKTRPGQARGAYAFHEWIRESLHRNKPYDRFAREIVAASGDVGRNPPVVWYRSADSQTEQVEDAAQVFLGLRIQCARCHHHPFERWSQDDYYGFAAFFSRAGRKKGSDGREDESRIVHQRGGAAAQNPRTGQSLKPAGLGIAALEIAPDDDPRLALADWMVDPGNAFFAPALANRYWKHFFGRGLVEPEDDLRVTNPPSNPELLAALAAHFVKSGFDLKELARTICRSSTYQLSSDPNPHNARDRQNFSRYYPKRLPAEVLDDAISLATGVPTAFPGLPGGTRAVALPDASAGNYFLNVFGKPQGESACECERSQEASLAQSLHLLNSAELQRKLAADGGRAARLAGDAARGDEEKVRDLHVSMLSRQPSPEDLAVALDHLKKPGDRRRAYEDLLWALMNTKEFLFNH